MGLHYYKQASTIGNGVSFCDFNGDGLDDITLGTESSNTADLGKIPFCSAFFDFNGDKWPDIYTANDKLTGNTLLLNNRNKTFTDISVAASADARMNAMCVAIARQGP